jgi:predicted permease
MFAVASCMVTGILIGLAPALYATKSRLMETLKEGGRASTYHLGGARARSVLVTIEVALALLLAIGASLMVQSFARLAAVNPGFDPHNVLAIDIGLTGKKYEDPAARLAFFSGFLNRMRVQPGVQSVGATIALPLSGSDSGTNFVIEGKPELPYAQQPNARIRVVTEGYFETMRIPLRAGRSIGATDSENAPAVAWINETMARQFWPDEAAIGKQFSLSGERKFRQIAGIVGDVKHYSLNGETRPELYLPFTQQRVYAMTTVIRTAVAPESLTGAARNEVAQMDKDQPIARMRTVDELLSLSVAQPRLYSGALASFSFAALLLAAIGIYGVMSFIVRQRTHEIGLRMALGAPAHEVRSMVLRQGLKLAVAGIICGAAGAVALTRVFGSLLYGIGATDPATFAGTALLLTVVAGAACYGPARRATRVDPLIALRCD